MSCPSSRISSLVDLYNFFLQRTDLDLDDVLYDDLHFNSQGHQIYAEQIFRALGGAEVGGEGLGTDGSWGLMAAE